MPPSIPSTLSSPAARESQAPSTPSQNSSLQQPKLRLSCDGCAAAKVRCSKERPRCERCQGDDLNCLYGRSMKHGKRSKMKRLAYQTKDTENSTYGATPDSIDLQRSLANILTTLTKSRDISEFPHQFAIPSTAQTAADRPYVSDVPFDDPRQDQDENACEAGSDVLPLTGHDLIDNMACTWPTGGLSLPDLEPLLWDEWIQGDSGGQTYTQPPLQSERLGSHNCNEISNSTMDMLYFRSQNPAQTVRNLDHVLGTITLAAQNVSHLLKCSCATQPHMMMLYASIVMRIVFWYQVAAGVHASSVSMPTTSEEFPTLPVGMLYRDPCSTQTAFVASGPVSIGNYVPDEEDQESARRMVVLGGLKRIRKLVEEFVVLTGAARSEKHGTSDLHSVLASYYECGRNGSEGCWVQKPLTTQSDIPRTGIREQCT